VVQQVLQFYREPYFDFHVRHFHARLQEAHGTHLSDTWVKTCLQTAGLISRRRRHGPHRPRPGMLLQLDGSEHRWIPGLPGRQTWLAITDDATNVV
jgi:hypothetical protein